MLRHETTAPDALPPVVFLDVDGVLAPTGSPPLNVPSDDLRWLDLPSGRYWFRRSTLDALTAHFTRLEADVHWLTTWYVDAPTLLAPALGLGTWPHHTKATAVQDHGWRPGLGWWKESVVTSYLRNGRRVVWIDDQIDEECAWMPLLYGPDRLTLVCPDPAEGLLAADLDALP